MKIELAKRVTAIWFVTVLAALGAGYYGGWLLDWIDGNTVTASVDSCNVAYGWNEFRYANCIGNWHHLQSEGEGNVSYVGSGPVLGIDVDPTGAVLNDDGKLAGAYAGEYFASLNGRAAVVIPRLHLILGPMFLAILLLCGITLIATRPRR